MCIQLNQINKRNEKKIKIYTIDKHKSLRLCFCLASGTNGEYFLKALLQTNKKFAARIVKKINNLGLVH
jgi:hypothetical protein